MPDNRWVDDVLGFWFGELGREDWFGGKTETDDAVTSRFLDLHARLQGEFDPQTVDEPRMALAAVILFDQFPRHMFRRTAKAFSTDAQALAVARRSVDKGLDAAMSPIERQFLYMPFMHSEVSADQERCVDLFKTLDNEEGVRYAIEHRDIIDRFGRFPHRNRALRRESTQEEQTFLEGHAGYGQ